MDEKSRIRQNILKKRDSLDPETRKSKDLRIKETLLSLPEFRNARTIFFFASFRSEVSTFPLMEEALRLAKKVILPLAEKTKKELRLYEVRSLSELITGFMGIPEPNVPAGRERNINDADLVIMPGAAFDSMGNRLGYGAGYYDKLLAGLKRKSPLVAIAYEEQIVDSIPSEPHDVKVQAIVTDKRVIRCGEIP